MKDLVIADLAREAANLEAALVDALTEAAAYRVCLMLALQGWGVDGRRLDRAVARVRELMGVSEDDRGGGPS